MRRNGRDVQRKFVCGIGVLFVFIAIGVFAAESQLNELTLESEFAKVLNIKRDQAAKEVAFYCFGERTSLGEWETPVVEMKNDTLAVRFGEEKKIVLSMEWLSDVTGKKRADVLQDMYGYYKKAGDTAQTMRETLEKSYGTILENLSDYL